MRALALACIVWVAMAVTVAAEPVRILMHDGSFVLAEGLPELRGGKAYFRMHPSGILTMVDAARIDLPATRRLALQPAAAAPAEEPERIKGTLSGGAPPGGTTPAPSAPPVLLLSPLDQALEEQYARRFTDLSQRQEALERDIRTLEADEIEVEGELKRYLGTPRLAGALADKLRAVQEHLLEKETERESVRQALQALLNEAARRAIPVRRLPPGS
jgi:hypothetical protein